MSTTHAYGAIFSGVDVRDYQMVCSAPSVEFPEEFELKTVRIKNQETVGSCHDKYTEVLTKDGWKLFQNITYDDYLASVDPDTGDFIFERPVNILKERYCGDLVCGKHRSLDFRVTPNHKMVVRKWVESERKLDSTYRFVDAESLGWWCGLKTDYFQHKGEAQNIVLEEETISNGNVLPRKEIPMSDWVQLVGIYLAEGTMYQNAVKHHYRIQIAAVKDREKTYVRELLTRMGIVGINEQSDRFHFHNKRIWKKFESYGLVGVKSYDKFVPDFIFDLDAEYIKLFLYGYAMGDGNFRKNGSIEYYTSSKVMAEQLQMLLLMSGTYSRITEKKPEDKKPGILNGREIIQKHTAYSIVGRKRNGLSITRKTDISREHYDDFVYCAEVPTYHTLITRRNGCILLSGNCVAHALSSIIEYYNANQRNDPTEMSVGYIYGNRTNSEHKDSGMVMRDALDIVVKYGDVPKEYFPYNEETPRAIRLYEKAADELYEVGRPNRISEYCRVNTVSAAKLAIMAGAPLLMAMEWYDDMEVNENGILTTKYEGYAGGHCMYIYGWNEHGWLIANSWGEDWGINGTFTLPYEMGMAECWAVMDDIIEGAYMKKPFKSKAGRAFAKVINAVCNIFV